MKEVILGKVGSMIEFEFTENGRKIYYDFKDNSYTSYTGRNVSISTIRGMLSKSKLNTAKSNKVYVRLFEIISYTTGYSNLGSMLAKLQDFQPHEMYLSQGYNIDWSFRSYHARKIANVPKDVLRIYRDCGAKINCLALYDSTERENCSYIYNFIKEMSKICENKEMLTTLNSLGDGSSLKNIINLSKLYNYNTPSLVRYIYNIITHEGSTIISSLRYLDDYCKMQKDMNIKNIDKYPRYLHTTHDIITRNYNSYKMTYDQKQWENQIKLDLEYQHKEYCIIYPKQYQEVQLEGCSLNHCVASYVDKVMNGKCDIVFLRYTTDKETSLVTVEINKDTIVQAKGSYNRKLINSERKFLEKYANKKELKISEYL